VKLLVALMLCTALTVPADAKPKSQFQSCTGVLVLEDDGEYGLKPDDGSTPWCGANVNSGEYIGGENLVPRVLKVCPVGSRCHIEGTFEGHGVFYWNKITAIKKLPTRAPTTIPSELLGEWCSTMFQDCTGSLSVTEKRVLGQGGENLDCEPLRVQGVSKASYKIEMSCTYRGPTVKVRHERSVYEWSIKDGELIVSNLGYFRRRQ
jgi:hypothetical protein